MGVGVKDKAQSMSGAGLLVVGTLCLSLVLAVLTACALALRGLEVPPYLETLIGGLSVGVPALLAKTYRDAPSDEPVSVEVQEPVLTQEVGDAQY